MPKEEDKVILDKGDEEIMLFRNFERFLSLFKSNDACQSKNDARQESCNRL